MDDKELFEFMTDIMDAIGYVTGRDVSDLRQLVSDAPKPKETLFRVGPYVSSRFFCFFEPTTDDLLAAMPTSRPSEFLACVEKWLSLPRQPLTFTEIGLGRHSLVLTDKEHNVGLDLEFFGAFASRYWPLEFHAAGDSVAVIVVNGERNVGLIARHPVGNMEAVYTYTDGVWRYRLRVPRGVYTALSLEAHHTALIVLKRIVAERGGIAVFCTAGEDENYAMITMRRFLTLAGCDYFIAPAKARDLFSQFEIGFAKKCGLEVIYV